MNSPDNNVDLPSGKVVAAEEADQRLDAITRELLKQAVQRVSLHGDFRIILSSNEMLDTVYCRLMYDPDLRSMPWAQTHIWFLQENRDQLIDETIIMHSGIPEEQVHRGSFESAFNADPDFRLDCCVLELDDLNAYPLPKCDEETVLLVLAEDRNKLALVTDWTREGPVYWFTETIDLNQENP